MDLDTQISLYWQTHRFRGSADRAERLALEELDSPFTEARWILDGLIDNLHPGLERLLNGLLSVVDDSDDDRLMLFAIDVLESVTFQHGSKAARELLERLDISQAKRRKLEPMIPNDKG